MSVVDPFLWISTSLPFFQTSGTPPPFFTLLNRVSIFSFSSVQVHSYLKEQHSLKEQLTTVVPWKNYCSLKKQLVVLWKKSCSLKEQLVVLWNKSCSLKELLVVLWKNSCSLKEQLVVLWYKSCSLKELLVVLWKNSCSLKEQFVILWKNYCSLKEQLVVLWTVCISFSCSLKEQLFFLKEQLFLQGELNIKLTIAQWMNNISIKYSQF